MSNLIQSEGSLQIYLESYMSNGGELTLYLNSSQGASWKPAKEDFNVSLGKEVLSVTGVKTVKEAETPVTILFLVDVSGSLDSRRMEDMKTVISGVTENLGEQDKVCIVAMGDELRTIGFLTDKEEIQAQIDALSVLKEDTNLYQGIEESLKILQSEDTAGGKKCLVVLSDGAEDNSYGITREEVNAAIQDSRIPVYTVGMPKNTESDKQLDSVKVLGSFARISSGGIHYVPALEGTDFAQTADNIWDNIMAGQVLTVDISGISSTGREVYLQISVETEGNGILYTGATVVDSRILTEKSEEEGRDDTEQGEKAEENADTETLQTEEETRAEAGGTEKSTVPILAGIAVLAAVIIGLLFIVFRKKKRKAAAEVTVPSNDGVPEGSGHTESPEADIGSLEAEEAGSPETVGMNGSREESVMGSAAMPFAGMDGGGAAGLPIQLIRMGIGETITYSLTVGRSLSMGRDLQASDFALPEDRGLSGRHCVFRYEEGHLFLEDAGSTNGTYVNGIPIKTPMRLNRDDVLLMGSYEYRIYW